MSGDEGVVAAEGEAGVARQAGAEDQPTAEGQLTADGDDTPEPEHASLIFLAGLVAFLVSALAFVADLVTGYPIARSLVVNGIAAAVLVAWAGADSYGDPDSGVETLSGAVGTALMLVGLYLVFAGGVVAVTSLRHGRLLVGLAMVAGGIPLILGGFVALPIDDVLGSARVGDDDGGAEEPNGDEEPGTSDQPRADEQRGADEQPDDGEDPGADGTS